MPETLHVRLNPATRAHLEQLAEARHFAGFALDAIRSEDVDRYKSEKLREGALGANQVNKTLGLLGRVLKAARRYGYIERNPLGDVDRLRGVRPNRPTLDPEQFPSILDVASAGLWPMLMVMGGAGLRNGEACGLDWRDVNLASGTLTVRAAKTDAGVRRVDLPLAVREILADHKARSEEVGSDHPVFVNRSGRRQTVSNVERRFKTTIRAANKRLAKLCIETISETATPHSLRRLYASMRYALGDDPVYVARQMGHADHGTLSMSVYAAAVRRRERLVGAALQEFDRALQLALAGTVGQELVTDEADALTRPVVRTALQSRNLRVGPDSSAG